MWTLEYCRSSERGGGHYGLYGLTFEKSVECKKSIARIQPVESKKLWLHLDVVKIDGAI